MRAAEMVQAEEERRRAPAARAEPDADASTRLVVPAGRRGGDTVVMEVDGDFFKLVRFLFVI